MTVQQMFTQLPTVSNAMMTDIVCAVQGYSSPSVPGLSVQETLQQIYNLFQSNIILSNAGNPNGVVAGTTYQLCWDTTNHILYVCTISGTSSTAVWTASTSLPGAVLLNPSADQNILAHNLIVSAGGFVSGASTGSSAGNIILYAPTASKGYLEFLAANNAANYAVIISNASFGQASTILIPDVGAASGSFILNTTAAGTQNIATNITTLNITSTTGNIISGSSGVQGSIAVYAPTASKGLINFTAANNAANYTITLTNASFGQASTLTIPDPGNAAANFVLNTGATTMAAGSSIVLAKVNGTEAANAVTASGVAGLITTSSLSTAGAGSYAITWTNTFITSSSVVLLTIAGGTNTTQNITLKCVPGSGTATLTIYNNTAATALNGTILISYLVM